MVYHSEHNRGLLDRVTAGWSYVHKKLVHQESHADGLSRDDYQAYLASPAFWNEMPAENILIFQVSQPASQAGTAGRQTVAGWSDGAVMLWWCVVGC